MHPLRKSLKPPKERGKKVDSTLLDVKASTLQHVGQPYTVGRAGSTRNKETTEASVRKRFELAYVENLLNFFQFFFLFFFFFLTFFFFLFFFFLFSFRIVVTKHLVSTMNKCIRKSRGQETKKKTRRRMHNCT